MADPSTGEAATGEAATGEAAACTVRFFAGARAAAGTKEDSIASPPGGTVGDVLAAAVRRHGADLDRVLSRCSFLLDGVHAERAAPVSGGQTLDVLPPFAGG